MGPTNVMRDLKSEEGCLGFSGGSDKIIGTLEESSPSEERGGREEEKERSEEGACYFLVLNMEERLQAKNGERPLEAGEGKKLGSVLDP